MNDLGSLRRNLDRSLADYRLASRQVEAEQGALSKAEERITSVAQAQQLVQQVAEQVQQQAHQQVASVVTRCLQAVGFDYEFRIKFVRKRGKTEAELLFVRDDVEIDPTDAAGGGAIDVASFALRLSCLMLSKPQRRRLLVLDEPFKFTSKDFRPAVRELLLTLAKEMKIQFILVSHQPELMCGKVIEIG